MKQIIIILAVVLFVGCSRPTYSVRISGTIDEIETCTTALEMWKDDIEINDILITTPRNYYNVVISFKDRPAFESSNTWGIILWDGKEEKPDPLLINIYTNNEVVCAHEWGHVRGLLDDYTNENSIMYCSDENLSKDLEDFDEFD